MLCPGCFKEKGDINSCPYCGYDESLRRSPLVLPHRSILNGQYMVGKILGKPGGFGITYLGLDIQLETLIAIKEFLPRDLASRDLDQLTVATHSEEESGLFHYGLEQFLQEARTMAKIDHLNVVRIRNFFKENGTAYLVMDYYEGITLAEYLLQKGGKLPEKTAIDIMLPILDGLREIHQRGFLHRDIKPQNIYLSVEGRPILLDLGAARTAMGERNRSLSVVLTPGFAPYEQYHRRGEQGPWTDIYACGATLYYMVTGSNLIDAAERMVQDELPAPHEINAEVSMQLSQVIMKAVSLEPHDRPQTVQEFIGLLLGQTEQTEQTEQIEQTEQTEQTEQIEQIEHSVPPPLPQSIESPAPEMATVAKPPVPGYQQTLPIPPATPKISAKEKLDQINLKIKEYIQQMQTPAGKRFVMMAAAVVTAIIIIFGGYSYMQKIKRDDIASKQKAEQQAQQQRVAEQERLTLEQKKKTEAQLALIKTLKEVQEFCTDLSYEFENAKVPGNMESTLANFRDIQNRANQEIGKLPKLDKPEAIKILALQRQSLEALEKASRVFADYLDGTLTLSDGNPNWVTVSAETYVVSQDKLEQAGQAIEQLEQGTKPKPI